MQGLFSGSMAPPAAFRRLYRQRPSKGVVDIFYAAPSADETAKSAALFQQAELKANLLKQIACFGFCPIVF
ncbi:MAG: hypothetical protein J5968_05065 [Oscillospiraceae bacterium]|nr:hypothetical protein [Oscillospiraceae bacterium]